MIPLLVFYGHLVAVVAIFVRRYQEENIAEGFLAVFFFALIFFVGWSISSFIAKMFFEQEGLGTFLDRDALSLLLLSIGEAAFYFFYLRDGRDHESADAEMEQVKRS